MVLEIFFFTGLVMGDTTKWYHSFWFNTRPIWAKDQREFQKFSITYLIYEGFGEICETRVK
jgi:hypothetical protein